MQSVSCLDGPDLSLMMAKEIIHNIKNRTGESSVGISCLCVALVGYVKTTGMTTIKKTDAIETIKAAIRLIQSDDESILKDIGL